MYIGWTGLAYSHTACFAQRLSLWAKFIMNVDSTHVVWRPFFFFFSNAYSIV